MYMVKRTKKVQKSKILSTQKRQNYDNNSSRKANIKYQLFYSQATGGQICPKKRQHFTL